MVDPRSRHIFYLSSFAVGARLIFQLFQAIMSRQDETVTLHSGRSSASVHLFGATLTSWKVDGNEILFLSEKSRLDGTKAIRGGVPFVFPQFGPWDKGPQHGFARSSRWHLKDGSNDDASSATFVLKDNELSRGIWDYGFRIDYTITLDDDKLKMDVIVTNMDTKPFSFTILLHTYFSVPDVTACGIGGLRGHAYIDKVRNHEESVEDRDEVKVLEFTDRIYKNTTTKHTLSNLSKEKSIVIEKFNLPDTVVWNPWSENAKSMSDFGDDEWVNMICIEAGRVVEPISLEPFESYTASQTLSLI